LAVEAIVLTAFVLAGNTLLRPLVNAINRAPITEGTTEAIYEVRLTLMLNTSMKRGNS
jgi:putative Mg2+ transporter-C (MgtC) family protein